MLMMELPVHQNPKHGQDNWFYARVSNRGTFNARAFVVTFNVKPWAGTQFVYPPDFVPYISAAVAFNLAPGGSTIVKAKWPSALVPASGAGDQCLLASVYMPTDVSPTGKHVWEHNNLAQKNVTIVNLMANDSTTILFQFRKYACDQIRSLSYRGSSPARVDAIYLSQLYKTPL